MVDENADYALTKEKNWRRGAPSTCIGGRGRRSAVKSKNFSYTLTRR